MEPFQLPAWRKNFNREKFNKKNRIVTKFSSSMELVMKEAVTEFIDNRREPSLEKMYSVSEQFYRDVITASFMSATIEKRQQQGKKRLAKLPVGLPKSIKSLDQVFGDPKYWRVIMKRSRLLTDRLKRQYLAKLSKAFKEIMPMIDKGLISPQNAKRAMMSVWEASKPRVETIFRTETTKYFSETQVKFFEGDPEIIGFLFDSIKDVARTEICHTRHGLIYRPGTKLLNENKPPCHYNCRSHLIALANTEFNRRLMEEKSRDPSRVKVVPLPPDWR